MKSAMYVKNKGAIKKTAAALRPVMVQSSRNTELCIGLLKLITKKDAESNTARQQEIKVSADLRKVIRLTKIDVFKTCVFTTHLVTFNETFSEFGKNGKDTAVVWHEAWFGWLVGWFLNVLVNN